MLEANKSFNRGGYGYSCYDNGSSYSNGATLSFIASYRELAEQYPCSTKELSKSIRALEELGFIKAQNFYIRKKDYDSENNSGNDSKEGSDDAYTSQERQDRSLWKITVCLPEDCMLALAKVKDRSNLKDCSGIKLEGTNYIIDATDITTAATENTGSYSKSCSKSYINSVMEKLEAENTSREAKQDKKSRLENYPTVEDRDFLLSNPTQTLPASLSSLISLSVLDTSEASDAYTNVDKICKNNDVAKYDPDVAKSRLLLIKDPLLKIYSKSNLGEDPKVLFDDFLKMVKSDIIVESTGNKENEEETVRENATAGLKLESEVDSREEELKTKAGTVSERKVKAREKEFNIHSELIRAKLTMLPRDKAEKARYFAYSLISKKLACGITASLTKHELAKQLIHHAATWRPTKLGSISRDKEIDTALAVAWKAIVAGTWQVPLELARAEVLQYEFRDYRKKYLEFGVLSHEAKALETEVSNLLGKYCDLVGKITEGGGIESRTLEDNAVNDWNVSNTLTAAPDLITVSSLNREALLNRSLSGIGIKRDIKRKVEQKAIKLGAELNDFQLDVISDLENSELNPCLTNNNDNNYQIDNKHLPNDDQHDQIKRGCHSDRSCSINLSRLSEPQRYLKVTPSDTKGDDSILLETTNGKEYCVRLKELEMNDNGEFVMTLKPIKTNIFLEHCSSSMLNIELEQSSVTNFNFSSNTNTSKVIPSPKENQIDSCHSKPLDLATLEKLALEQEAALGRDEYLEKILEFSRKDKGIS